MNDSGSTCRSYRPPWGLPAEGTRLEGHGLARVALHVFDDDPGIGGSRPKRLHADVRICAAGTDTARFLAFHSTPSGLTVSVPSEGGPRGAIESRAQAIVAVCLPEIATTCSHTGSDCGPWIATFTQIGVSVRLFDRQSKGHRGGQRRIWDCWSRRR